MRRRYVALFLSSAALQVAATTFCALWPIRGHLSFLRHGWWDLYSVQNSNLDIWLLTIAHSWLLLLLTGGTACLAQGQSKFVTSSQMAVTLLSSLCQTLLLAKSVVVALLGDDDIMPSTRKLGNAGLLYLFASVALSSLGVAVQTYAVQNILAGKSRRVREDRSDTEQPLLWKGEEEANTKGHSHTVPALLRYSAKDSPLLAVAFTAGALAALGQALIPYYTGRIIDYATIDPDRHSFMLTTLRLVGVSLACALATGVRGGLFTIAMTRLNVRIRSALFASLLRQEIGFYDSSKTGDITSRLSADTTTVSDQICLNINVIVRSTTQAAMVLGFMFQASWRLTVITFIMLPACVIICRVYGAYYRKLATKVQTELAEANSVAEEVLSSMTNVKAHAAEDSALSAYSYRLKKFYTLQLKEALAYAAYMATNTFLPNVVNAIVLFYGGTLVLAGHMSAGALVSFIFYQQSLSSAFQSMGDVFSSLMAAVGAADKVVELIRRQPKVVPLGALTPSHFSGDLQLDNIVFSYPGRPSSSVLNGLSLRVQPGEVVALVGPSGGGKSSIVKLIERFYVPTSGRVLLDGRDVGLYQPQWLKRKVALVSQEPTLYARSIRRNICYGLEEEDGVPPEERPSQADIEEAARQANAHDFIMAMPEGYDSECGERGVALSGGQKQRIAIARALVRRPTVLLLDEATSALDADSEAAVQEALDRLMKEHTVLVIAHRLSTIQNANRILIISKGAIVEEGTHEQLLEAGGVYSALIRRQLSKSSSVASLSALHRPESSTSLEHPAAPASRVVL